MLNLRAYRYTLIRRVLIAALALSFALTAGACGREDSPTDGERELAIYLAACPAGPFACFEACLAQNDSNGNGVIEGSEEFLYNICAGQCQSQCSLAWIFWLSQDDQ